MVDLERVTRAIDWLIFNKKVKNRRDLAKILEYTESSLSQILNNKVPLSDNFTKKLAITFDSINEDWLLTGDGQMLKEDDIKTPTSAQEDDSSVLLLPISAQGGSLNDFVVSVNIGDCERIISPIKGADFAISVTGDSMEPEYPSGSKILIKKINERAFIEWGRCYVLDTCNGTVVKKLMPSDDPEKLKCVSTNTEYPPFDVYLTDIFGVYRVLMMLAEK